MKKGISLITLIITIVVILILASIAIFSSLNTIDESQNLKSEAEFNEVASFVGEISSRAMAGLIDLDLPSSTEVTTEKLQEYNNLEGVSASEINNVNSANADTTRGSNFKYHYITGKQIENANIVGVTVDATGKAINDIESNFSIPNKVDNDYIINFYYGTVIAKISDDKAMIRGTVK